MLEPSAGWRQREPSTLFNHPQFAAGSELLARGVEFFVCQRVESVAGEKVLDSPDVEGFHLVSRVRVGNQVDIHLTAVLIGHTTSRAMNRVLDAAGRPTLAGHRPLRTHREHDVLHTGHAREISEQPTPDLTKRHNIAPDSINSRQGALIHAGNYARISHPAYPPCRPDQHPLGRLNRVVGCTVRHHYRTSRSPRYDPTDQQGSTGERTMAWSLHGRYLRGCTPSHRSESNCVRFALDWYARVTKHLPAPEPETTSCPPETVGREACTGSASQAISGHVLLHHQHHPRDTQRRQPRRAAHHRTAQHSPNPSPKMPLRSSTHPNRPPSCSRYAPHGSAAAPPPERSPAGSSASICASPSRTSKKSPRSAVNRHITCPRQHPNARIQHATLDHLVQTMRP
ncbi:hypothetical protein C8D88_10882 [Lentzea atacamensis]|uniref:Uncharacterized protein n=1 Tax=Lentzea atacamensis TaxID=531938 RepID=A0A316HVM1_9PSEU|nr:hypothetical protein C8D88_10882 [Lentzea atacamensis]